MSLPCWVPPVLTVAISIIAKACASGFNGASANYLSGERALWTLLIQSGFDDIQHVSPADVLEYLDESDNGTLPVSAADFNLCLMLGRDVLGWLVRWWHSCERFDSGAQERPCAFLSLCHWVRCRMLAGEL